MNTNMLHEYIVETKSGSIYHVAYNKHFWKHGGRFTCRQLHGRTKDFGRDDTPITDFGNVGDLTANRHKELDLGDFKVGKCMKFGGIGQTSPIVKIFQRIH